jgi:hypothetical protein
MEQILDKLHNFSFDIEFNDINIYKLNLAKKIKPLMFQFMCIEKFINDSDNITQDVINNYVNIQKKIINKIKDKIKIEHSDEVDLINVYTNKLKKFISQTEYNNQILDKIYNIVNTPLEGEMAKHNKIKVITCKLINTNNELDVIFYVKYKECDGYNKQFNTLLANVLESIK